MNCVIMQTHYKELNNYYSPNIPESLQTLYYSLLEEGCTVKSCKKKWFRDHYIIQIWSESWLGYEEFHLTPEKIWWKAFY